MRCAVIGFVLGIFLLQQQGSLWSWLALCLLGGLVGIALFVLYFFDLRLAGFPFSTLLRFTLIFCIGSCVGWIWASGVAIVKLSQPLAPELEERDITVIGVISNLPSRADFGQRFQFSIERVLTEKIPLEQLPKTVLLNFYTSQFFGQLKQNASPDNTITLQPGERWQFRIRLRRPHGLANPHGFDYEMWLLERGIGATGSVKNNGPNQALNYRIDRFVPSLNNYLQRIRGKLRDHILAALPNQPYAPVIVALVIGEQNAISQADWTVFARTGISHLIAISGLHITLLSGMIANMAFFLWRSSFFTRSQLPLRLPSQKIAAVAGMLTAVIYVALAGFGVPAQRTLVMICVAAVAGWFDRVTSVTNVLCVALVAVLLLDPWAVLAPGFWLSFGAVGFLFYVGLGRGELSQPTLDATLKQKCLHHLRQASITQYAITLGLVPLTILLFSQVSLVSPVANAIAIPLVSFVITPCALLGSVLPDPIGEGILIFSNFVLQYLGQWLTWLSQFSWAVWHAPRPLGWMFVLGLLGTYWCLAPKGWPLRWAGILTWLPLCLNSSVYAEENHFKITALDVGQGSSVLIETQHHRLLYDTGPAYSHESDAGVSVIYPYLTMRGISELDGLMISHSDNDHSGGAWSLIQRVRVGWVMSSLELNSPLVQNIEKTVHHKRCLAGQSWEWDGVRFELLHPSSQTYSDEKAKPNSKSCTLKISRGVHSVLLAGDIEAAQEKELVSTMPDKLAATALLVPHHGSGTSSTSPFLHTVQPKIAIFQMGYHNRYHHPKPSVWQRYADLGINRLRSDQVGAITIDFGDEVSDQVSVEEYRLNNPRYWYPKVEGGGS